MEKNINKKRNNIEVFTFILFLFIMWGLKSILVKNATYIESFILKFVIFVVYPVIYFRIDIKKIKENFEIKKNVRGLIFGIVGVVGIIFLGAIYTVLLNKKIVAYLSVGNILHCFIFAAFFEEVCFRGIILQKISESFNFFKSNVITSIFFLLIHLLGYIIKNNISEKLIISLVIIFITSIIFGYFLKITNSLITVIILHAVYDCTVHVIGY